MSQITFVGRKNEQDLYANFLNRNTPWVLIITGLGGIGKSTLLHTLSENTPSYIGVIALDFADRLLRTDPSAILEQLVKGFAPFCQLRQERESTNNLHEDLKQLARLSAKPIWGHAESKDVTAQGIQTDTNDAEVVALLEIQHHAREIATEAFYDQVETFDLKQLVIMLDTCEWLSEPEGWEVGQWIMNELIPELHMRMKQKERQCSVVIASRMKPQLEVIDRRDQEHIVLSMLDKEAVDQYLEQRGMQEPEFRRHVYDITYGHALCVSIIGKLWQERGEREQTFTVADLPVLQEFSEFALMQFTNERVLKHLKSPYLELTRYGILLQNFNLPLLRAIFPDLLPEPKALDLFEQLIHYPYVEFLGNHRYAFHELLREALAEEFQKEESEREKLKIYHKRALDYFTEVSPYSSAWYYHAIAYDEKSGMEEWRRALQEATPDQLGTLLQVTYDKTLNLTLAGQAIRDYEHGRFHFEGAQWLEAMGNAQQAHVKRKEALESYRKALKIFQETDDNSGLTATQQAIDILQQPRNLARITRKSYRGNNTSVAQPLPSAPSIATPLTTTPTIRKYPKSFLTKLLISLPLIFLIISSFVAIFIKQSNSNTSSPSSHGIAVNTAPDGEHIGISDGTFVFDTNRFDGELKIQAANKLRIGDIVSAESFWNQALSIDTNDAEALIYKEDQRVLATHRPFITLAIGTILTGIFTSAGRDSLQGAYVAQKEHNDQCLNHPNCIAVRLLIANSGSGSSSSEGIAYASFIMQQIVKVAQADKTLIGVMGWPLSSSSFYASTVLGTAHIPIVSPVANTTPPTQIPSYFFNVAPSIERQGFVGANYAEHKLNAKRVALFVDPVDPYSQSLADAFNQQFTADGKIIVTVENFTVGNPKTVNLRLPDALSHRPDLIYFAGHASDVNALLTELPPCQVSSCLQVMGGDAFYDFVGYTPGNQSQLYRLHFTSSAFPDAWEILAPHVSKPPFFSEYSRAFNPTTANHANAPYGYTRADNTTILSYDATLTLLKGSDIAFSRVGNYNFTPNDLQQVLTEITGNQALQGASGRISFGPDSNPTNKTVLVLSLDANFRVHFDGAYGCFLKPQPSVPQSPDCS